MNEHPILFSSEMVRAILEGRKTQTRRVIKLADGSLPDECDIPAHEDVAPNYIMDFSKTYPYWKQLDCPYGNIGDRLWVREAWQGQTQDGRWWHQIPRAQRDLYNWAWTNPIKPAYDATPPRWLPGIHMKRETCRIELEIVNIRVERVQDIDNHESWREGIPEFGSWLENEGEARDEFARLWNSINCTRGYGWDVNPFVWVIEFRKVNR
jgi:hypothetical protein